MSETAFNGVKIALITQDNHVVVLLRDDKPGLRFAGMWDLPGGGREGSETPVQCMQREVMEELGIVILANTIKLQKRYASMHLKDTWAYFMIAELSGKQLKDIVFGGEGQTWQLMKIDEFINHGNAVPDLQERLKENLPPESQRW